MIRGLEVPVWPVRKVGAVLVAMLLVAQVGMVSAQKGGIGGLSTAPVGTPGPRMDASDLDPAALDGLGDLLHSADGGSREGVPDQIRNEEYGFTIDYLAPWQSHGTWDTDGFEQEYFIDPANDALVSVTAWEWTGSSTVQGTIAWWASSENLAGWLPDAQVLQVWTGDTTGGVVFYHPPTTEYPDAWLYVSELHVHDGYAIEVMYSSTLPVFADAYPSAGESVMVNGVPVVGIFSMDEILAAVPSS